MIGRLESRHGSTAYPRAELPKLAEHSAKKIPQSHRPAAGLILEILPRYFAAMSNTINKKTGIFAACEGRSTLATVYRSNAISMIRHEMVKRLPWLRNLGVLIFF